MQQDPASLCCRDCWRRSMEMKSGRLLYLVVLVAALGSLGQARIGLTCANLYERYCRQLTADKCFLSYNRRLCCKTCTNFHRRYSQLADELACMPSSEPRHCSTMPSNLCYGMSNRHMCCNTCAQIRRKKSDCRYGDRDLRTCPDIRATECYSKDIETMCCETCARFKKGPKDCQYGDQPVLFKEKRRLYTCGSYVGHFGNSRCRGPDSEGFHQVCCKSCRPQAQPYFSRFRAVKRYG